MTRNLIVYIIKKLLFKGDIMRRILFSILIVVNCGVYLFAASDEFIEKLFKEPGTYEDYKKTGYTSWKWDSFVKSGFKEMYFWEDPEAAIEKFKKAIHKGCVYPEIYRICVTLNFISKNLKDINIKDLNIAAGFIEDYWFEDETKKLFATRGEMFGFLGNMILVIEDYKNYDLAAKYYEKSDDPKEGFLLIAKAYQEKKDFIKTLDYYQLTKDPKTGFLSVVFDVLDYKFSGSATDNLETIQKYLDKLENPREIYLYIADNLLEKKKYTYARVFYHKAPSNDAGENTKNYGDVKTAEAAFENKDYGESYEIYSMSLNQETVFYEKLKGLAGSDSPDMLSEYYQKDKENRAIIESYLIEALGKYPSEKYSIHKLVNLLQNEGISQKLYDSVITRGEKILASLSQSDIEDLPYERVSGMVCDGYDYRGREVWTYKDSIQKRDDYDYYIKFPTISKYKKQRMR